MAGLHAGRDLYERGEALDELNVPKDQLRLVWNCPPDGQAVGEGSDRAA
jgi:hypothetical protein